MSGGAPGAQVSMTQEQFRRQQLLKERGEIQADSYMANKKKPTNIREEMFGNIRGLPEYVWQNASSSDPAVSARVAEIDKEIADIKTIENKKQAESEGFFEMPRPSSIALPLDGDASSSANKKRSSTDLDAQRAALGARRRQSLFSTSQSRSLLG